MAATPETVADDRRRRRIAIALIALVVALLAAQLTALALGSLEIAGIIFVVFCAGWFALRSYQRRTGRA